MTGTRRTLTLLVVAGVTVACAAILSMVIFNWSMTYQFDAGPPEFVLSNIGETFVLSFVGTALLYGGLWLLWRVGLQQRWAALALGGLLFWLGVSLIVWNPWRGLGAVPCGLIAAFIMSRQQGKLLGWPGVGIVLCGALVCAGLLIQPIFEARRLKRWERQRTAPSLLGPRIMGGAVFNSAIWLYNQDGKTASFDLRTFKPTLRASQGVVALQADSAGIWALLAPPLDWQSEHQPQGSFRLARYDSEGWRYSPWLDYAVDERPLALAASAQGPIVLGPKRLYIFDQARSVRTLPLSDSVGAMGQFATAVTAHTMYLGANRGEWGGGLLAVNLDSGNVASIDRRDTKELCSGPLNSQCDPVTALLPDAARPGCVFAAVGLAHFMWEGRVLRVCGSRIETVFQVEVLPIGKRIERLLSNDARRFPPETEPIFGLAPAQHGFWAVTPRAIYRWTPDGVDRQSLPKLQPVHGLALSQSLPGLLVLSTDANAARSLSGYTPLLFKVPTSTELRH